MGILLPLTMVASFFACLFFLGQFIWVRVRNKPKRRFGTWLIVANLIMFGAGGLYGQTISSSSQQTEMSQISKKGSHSDAKKKADATAKAESITAAKKASKASSISQAKAASLSIERLERAESESVRAESINIATSESVASKQSKQADDESSRVAASQAAEKSSQQAAQQAAIASSNAAAAAQSQQVNSRPVYITATGKRYHFDPNCRGLNRARSVSQTTLADAQAQGFTQCLFE